MTINKSNDTSKITINDLITETIEYYKSHKRAIVRPNNEDVELTSCEYYTSEGDMCAVGRCLKKECRNQEWAALYNNKSVYKIPPLYTILADKYSHITKLEFWEYLQDLHDQDGNWDTDPESPSINTLTELGKTREAYLRRNFG